MEIKDLLTPAITVLGVFLTARFALRNEHRKKALEIETTQLESLSVLYSGLLITLLSTAAHLRSSSMQM